MMFKYTTEFGIIITLEGNKVIPGGPVYRLIYQVAEIVRVSFTCVQMPRRTDFLKTRGTKSFQGLLLKPQDKTV